MLNYFNANENGEQKFFLQIKNHINVIFDVGCRSESEFLVFEGDVHYFDPVKDFLNNLQTQHNLNKNAYFNNFGLGNENNQIYYYPNYQSFYDRTNSCHVSDSDHKILLDIKRGENYVLENNIKSIDFLKIDTEGSEFDVIKGFGDFLQHIKIIQFEYGGTFLDNNVKLIDVVNYLQEHGFSKFAYLTNYGPVVITDFTDHYQYCNIVCINKNSDYVPYDTK